MTERQVVLLRSIGLLCAELDLIHCFYDVIFKNAMVKKCPTLTFVYPICIVRANYMQKNYSKACEEDCYFFAVWLLDCYEITKHVVNSLSRLLLSHALDCKPQLPPNMKLTVSFSNYSKTDCQLHTAIAYFIIPLSS